MAWNQEQQSITDEELAGFRTAMDEQRDELHEVLAEDLGGAPDDYAAKDDFDANN